MVWNYKKAIEDYNSEAKDYEEAKAEMDEEIKKGEIVPIIQIEKSDVKIGYVKLNN